MAPLLGDQFGIERKCGPHHAVMGIAARHRCAGVDRVADGPAQGLQGNALEPDRKQPI